MMMVKRAIWKCILHMNMCHTHVVEQSPNKQKHHERIKMNETNHPMKKAKLK